MKHEPAPFSNFLETYLSHVMKAVILAGGLGTRLQPFTEVIPKPLLPLGEKSILEIQISFLKEQGFKDIYIATNYMSEYIEAYLGNGSEMGLNIYYSREQKPLGTCGPLSLLRDELTEPFVVMNGDILTKFDFSTIHSFTAQHDCPLSVGTKTVLTPFRFGNVETDTNDNIVSVEEKPEFELEILAGVYGMKPEILTVIPDDEYFGMDSLIQTLLAEGQCVKRFPIEDYWLDIGKVEDYSKAREEYEEHFLQSSPA